MDSLKKGLGTIKTNKRTTNNNSSSNDNKAGERFVSRCISRRSRSWTKDYTGDILPVNKDGQPGGGGT